MAKVNWKPIAKTDRRGFYTDGTNVFQRSSRGDLLSISWNEPSAHFVGKGIDFARVSNYEKEVRLVQVGETFMDGRLVVENAKLIKAQSYDMKGAKYDRSGRCTNAEEVFYEPVIRMLTL